MWRNDLLEGGGGVNYVCQHCEIHENGWTVRPCAPVTQMRSFLREVCSIYVRNKASNCCLLHYTALPVRKSSAAAKR